MTYNRCECGARMDEQTKQYERYYYGEQQTVNVS